MSLPTMLDRLQERKVTQQIDPADLISRKRKARNNLHVTKNNHNLEGSALLQVKFRDLLMSLELSVSLSKLIQWCYINAGFHDR